MLKGKKNAMILLKHGKEDFIPKRSLHNRYNDNCEKLLQWGKETEYNFVYNMDKWEFLAKEQGKGDSGKTDLTRLAGHRRG